jgi:hypothetical protein
MNDLIDVIAKRRMRAKGIQPPPVVDVEAEKKIDALLKKRSEQGIGRFKEKVDHG